MQRMKRLLILLPLLFTLFAFTTQEQKNSAIIEGVVTDQQSNQPLKGAHVYVIDGEEESLTNSKGEFRIETWQKLPVKLTIAAKGYQTTQVTVSNAGKRQVIRLKAL